MWEGDDPENSKSSKMEESRKLSSLPFLFFRQTHFFHLITSNPHILCSSAPAAASYQGKCLTSTSDPPFDKHDFSWGTISENVPPPFFFFLDICVVAIKCAEPIDAHNSKAVVNLIPPLKSSAPTSRDFSFDVCRRAAWRCDLHRAREA